MHKPLETLVGIRDECLSADWLKELIDRLKEPLRRQVLDNYEKAKLHLEVIYRRGFTVNDDLSCNREWYVQSEDYRYLYTHFIGHVEIIKEIVRIDPRKR